MVITETQRRDLLQHYMAMEPELYLNTETYKLSVEYGQEYIVFYATNVRQHKVVSMALVTKDTWQMIHKGMPMAYLYTTVLERMESDLLEGIECSDIIELEL